MYKAIIKIDEENSRVEYFEKPRYVFKQTNGVVITTEDETLADGILSNDNSYIYTFEGSKLDTEEYSYSKCILFFITTNQYIKEMDDLKKSQNERIENNTNQMTEAQLALVDIYEMSDKNTSDVADISQQVTETQTALCDVYELVASMSV